MIFAVVDSQRLPVEIPTFPPARKASDFEIADGISLPVYQRGLDIEKLLLGTGNGDGHANPGERVAVLFPEGNAYRAAELFSNDACIDLSERVSEAWGKYDHVGASAKYTLARIESSCAPGSRIRALARLR
jgi:hypothetical protein